MLLDLFPKPTTKEKVTTQLVTWIKKSETLRKKGCQYHCLTKLPIKQKIKNQKEQKEHFEMVFLIQRNLSSCDMLSFVKKLLPIIRPHFNKQTCIT